MKNILIILTSILITSCASSPVTTSYDDVNKIKEDDFKPVKQVRYKKSDDKLNNVESEFSAALNEESLERVFRYDGSVDSKGPLGEISTFCYQNKFTEAELLIKQYNKMYLKNPIFWNHVGTCFLLKGERRKALLFFNKALSFKSNYAPALNNLGVMYMKEKDYSRALVAFKRARKSTDFSKTPRFNLSNLYLNFGLYDKVITHASTLDEENLKDVDVLNMLGTAYLMKNDFKSAIKFFSRIDSDYLVKGRFGINYSLALFLNGNKEKAINSFNDIDEKMNSNWNKYYRSVKNLLGVSK